MNQKASIEQHSALQSVFYHLIPGILTGAVYFSLIPVVHSLGYPSIMALMLAAAVMLTPLEVGILLYMSKKKNGRISLEGVVAYRQPIPIWQYLLWIPGLFVLLAVIFTLLKPVDAWLQQNLFSWVPVLESGLQEGFSKNTLVITYLLVAIFGTLAGPVVEELYFRGFLLPRMEYAGKWAPLLHSFLFALYHIWTPWMIVTRTLGMLPLALAVRRRNLYLSIVVHVMVNLVDLITGIGFIVGMSSLL